MASLEALWFGLIVGGLVGLGCRNINVILFCIVILMSCKNDCGWIGRVGNGETMTRRLPTLFRRRVRFRMDWQMAKSAKNVGVDGRRGSYPAWWKSVEQLRQHFDFIECEGQKDHAVNTGDIQSQWHICNSGIFLMSASARLRY